MINLKTIKNSPSPPPGLLAADAKHRGQETFKSIILCSGTPCLMLAAMLCFFFEFLAPDHTFWIKIFRDSEKKLLQQTKQDSFFFLNCETKTSKSIKMKKKVKRK